MNPTERAIFLDALTDIQAEALTAYGEARNQRVDGLIAVINVIRNRARIKKTRSVTQALAFAAFSCWLVDPKSTNDDRVAGYAHLLVADEPYPYDPVMDVCLMLAARSDLQDVTRGATHYYNFRILKPPNWTVVDRDHSPRKTVRIQDHEFWTNVRF